MPERFFEVGAKALHLKVKVRPAAGDDSLRGARGGELLASVRSPAEGEGERRCHPRADVALKKGAASLTGRTIASAVEFSFLPGLMTLGSATAYEAVCKGFEIAAAFGWVSPWWSSSWPARLQFCRGSRRYRRPEPDWSPVADNAWSPGLLRRAPCTHFPGRGAPVTTEPKQACVKVRRQA
jgi:hypothetical protein